MGEEPPEAANSVGGPGFWRRLKRAFKFYIVMSADGAAIFRMIGGATWRLRRSSALTWSPPSSRLNAPVSSERLDAIGTGRFSRRQDPGWRKGGSFADREPVSGDAERGVVMEDEFLVIACASAIWVLTRTSIGESFGQIRVPVLHGLALGLGSFDEQPF